MHVMWGIANIDCVSNARTASCAYNPLQGGVGWEGGRRRRGGGGLCDWVSSTLEGPSTQGE